MQKNNYYITTVILIAQSSSSKTEWAVVDNHKIVETCFTDGINPYFQQRIDISRIIRLQLPESFFSYKFSKIYFYGVGCNTEKACYSIKSPLETQLKAPAIVSSHLLGSSRALFGEEEGIICILETESSSGKYDGKAITRYVKSIGYILGDEGSAASLGKRFLADCLQSIAPRELIEAFYIHNKITQDEITDYVYLKPLPHKILALISYFIYENIENPYIHNLVAQDMERFLKRNILQYEDFQNLPIRFVGTTSKMYSAVIRSTAQKLGIYIDKIVESPIPGLAKYHQ